MVSEMDVGVYSDDLQKSKKIYADLLSLVPTFESDWVVQMTSKDNENLNLTLQLRTHYSIPEAYLDQGIEAHRELEERKHFGKIVITGNAPLLSS